MYRLTDVTVLLKGTLSRAEVSIRYHETVSYRLLLRARACFENKSTHALQV